MESLGLAVSPRLFCDILDARYATCGPAYCPALVRKSCFLSRNSCHGM